MKKTFKRMLAVIFAITMVLGLVPLLGEIVEAAPPTYENSVIAIDQFADQTELVSNINSIDNFIHDTFGKNVGTNTHPYTIASTKKAFKDAWNRMPSKQMVVVINTHGSPTSFCGMTTSDIKNLPYKEISYLVILGCNTGHYDWRTENVARTFADKFRCPVIACDGTVSSFESTTRTYAPKADSTWETYCSMKRPSRRNMYGWLVYIPKSLSNYYEGRLYQLGQRGKAMSVYDMLINYTNGNITSLPVK